MAKTDLEAAQSRTEAKARGRKGGRVSSLARQEKRTLRQALETLLEHKGEDGLSGLDALACALYEKALSGDVRAIVELRDTMGEKPAQKAETALSGSLEITWHS